MRHYIVILLSLFTVCVEASAQANETVQKAMERVRSGQKAVTTTDIATPADTTQMSEAMRQARERLLQQRGQTTEQDSARVENEAYKRAMAERDSNVVVRSVTISSDEIAIADSAFYKKLDLEELIIPASVRAIGRHSIDHCTKLGKLEVAESNPSLKSVDNVIYSKDGTTLILCSPAKTGEFVVPAEVTTIAPGAFSTCKRLKAVILPKGLKEIPEETFQGCWALEKVNLPEGLQRIGKRAFDGTIIQKMNMPTTMQRIDDEAFINTSIVEVNLRVTEPFELGENVFREIHVTRLNVPAAGLKAFKSHPKWGKFGRITPTHSYWTVDLP